MYTDFCAPVGKNLAWGKRWHTLSCTALHNVIVIITYTAPCNCIIVTYHLLAETLPPLPTGCRPTECTGVRRNDRKRTRRDTPSCSVQPGTSDALPNVFRLSKLNILKEFWFGLALYNALIPTLARALMLCTASTGVPIADETSPFFFLY